MNEIKTKKRSRYVIGIDLGTTNSAVSYIDTRKNPFGGFDAITPFQIPQVVSEGQVAKREGLPSFLYLSAGHDLPHGSIDLPWGRGDDVVLGEFARIQGARVPGRLVSSAKSWLCHPGVDRKAPILPWGDVGDIEKRSPVAAASSYLQHMRYAWNHTFSQSDTSLSMEHQDVVLTVPASFDEVARELTMEAARDAGLQNVTLLEEPQAAFYAWLARHEAGWDDSVKPGQTILVCDIGGGTTDFALIEIKETESGPSPERVAVGDHLLLGGDNMDLALAKLAEQRLMGGKKRLDSLRWHMLTAICRSAKEELLGGEKKRIPVSVPGRGRGVIGGALSTELTKQEVLDTIINGFFPDTGFGEPPVTKSGTGSHEYGLPFVDDTAIPRHLAAFIKKHMDKGDNALPRPDAIFFNGGVFSSPIMAERVIEILSGWFSSGEKSWCPMVLENNAPGFAVCQGASYYGMVRRGRGVRITGGSARSYYIGVAPDEKEQLAEKIQAVCVVPKGMEEGEEVEIDSPVFKVLANQPVSFSLYSSNDRPDDHLGDIVHMDEEELLALPPLRTVLQYGKKGIVRKIPVFLCAYLTELGTIELSCHSRKTEHRWRLQFDIRPSMTDKPQTTPKKEAPDKGLSEEALEKALQTIRSAFNTKKAQRKGKAIAPESIVKALRRDTGLAKEKWPMPVLRRFVDELLKYPDYRTQSPRHEERWLNLVGFCLRPGYGHGGDDFRIRQIFKLYYSGLVHHKDVQCQVEWWILWRRIAGGLQQKQQASIYRDVSSLLVSKKKKGKQVRRLTPRERTEMWRTVANLERLSVGTKEEMGRHLLKQLGTTKGEGLNMWVLSRLGSRVPLYGPLDTVIPGKIVTKWIKQVVGVSWKKPDHTAACLVQMACFTGDRERDVEDFVRDRIAERLKGLEQEDRLLQRMNESVFLNDAEQNWIFGEELPAGLHLDG